METITIISLIFVAYLLGSIPSAVWWGKRFYGIDVREFGSGNAGATNTFRVLGKKAGFPVLIIDILKGTCAVLLAHLSPYKFDTNPFVNLQLALGVSALIGHVFPVFVGFRGGKGVATILGVVICLTPITSALVLIVFLSILILTRYVSLSSILSGFSYPIFLNLLLDNQNETLMIFSIFVSALLVITHKKNISRLIRNQESRVNFFATRKN
ncbi:MAG: glycerol-3-phosphate 1-O-acyltransferase PlsY [Bacteroidota bacterium]|jgi:glycerol-3-phosphate acyltransferase PlsY